MPTSPGAREGLIMAAGVLVVTAVLAWRQWAERRSRDLDLSIEDERYYSRRDVRRLLGTTTLALIGFGMLVGSLIEPRKHPVAFLSVWLVVGVLVLVSLALAMLDIFANQAYAQRHRRILIEERRTLLEEELRRHVAGQNGHGEPLP
jgi:cobalamin biosynthesis protein CobD/CbiB